MTPQPEVSTQQADLETDAPTAWLETAVTPQPEVSTQQADLETGRPTPDIRRDVAVAMNLARKAVAIAAKAAEDDLRNMRELLESTEARAKGAEERAELAEARVAETEKLLADIRDHITAKVAHLCGA